MTEVDLLGGWKCRHYQKPFWRYMAGGGKRAIKVWHRRSGKDETDLKWTINAAHRRVGTYWHMLPEAAQARKSMWNALNPHTGKRRIDEVFPPEIRANTRDDEMFIRFKNESTWQLVGSDNYDSLVGAPPVGIVFSEWALAKPSAWAYMRPILLENNGWAVFNTTPRGTNHAKTMLDAGRADPAWFAETLTVEDTGVFTPEQMAAEEAEYRREYGDAIGEAMFRQEYHCSFHAAILGSFYGGQIAQLERGGRLVNLDGRSPLYDPDLPVDTAWDLGRTDDTAIWFCQQFRGEPRIIDYYVTSGQDVDHYCEVLDKRGYTYDRHFVPHDAKHKTMASRGKSIIDQARALGVKMTMVEEIGVENGIQAVRQFLPLCWFDHWTCQDGIEALRQYRRKWDEQRRVLSREPVHDWTSHPADAFRMLAVAYRVRSQSRKREPFDPNKRPSLDKVLAEYDREQRRLHG